MKEQAQKEGWAKATKLQNRSMSSGLVAIVSNKQAATMIEVNRLYNIVLFKYGRDPMIEVNRLYNTMLFKYGRDHTLEVFEHLSIVCYVLNFYC